MNMMHKSGIDHAGYYGADLSAPFSIIRLWPMLPVILAAAFMDRIMGKVGVERGCLYPRVTQ